MFFGISVFLVWHSPLYWKGVLYYREEGLIDFCSTYQLCHTHRQWVAHVSGPCPHDSNFCCSHVLSYFSLC